MTEAEEQELFARLERLERSAWRWRWFASALAVSFLLLLSLGLVSSVAFRTEADRRRLEELQRARLEQAPDGPTHMLRADDP